MLRAVLGVFLFVGGCVGLRRPPLAMLPLRGDSLPTPPAPLWFTQRLDHFQSRDNRTWQQRYQVSDSFYKSGGPVFLLISGEWTLEQVWMVAGNWLDYARQHGALLFQLEHRFYGESRPTEDMSTENLRYLTTEQALADLAAFTVAMKTEHNLTDDQRWVSFGGSYPGILSAWYRLKYPHLVHAAVATSAPIMAETDFDQCLEVVGDSIMTKGGAKCYDGIAEAFQEVGEILSDPNLWLVIALKFQMCSPFDGSNPLDVSNLLNMLATLFEQAVQHNGDNRAFLDIVDVNITSICDIMTYKNLSALDRLAVVNALIMKINNQTCLDYRYDTTITQLRDARFSEEGFMRQWVYQTCTEFGFFATSDSKSQPFGHHVPLSFYTQQCMDVFGEQFNEEFIRNAVAATNEKYGAFDIQATRVVFTNGNIDPWHALGLKETFSEDRPVILINGTSHCANMYPPSDGDPVELVEARAKVGEYLAKWLSE